MEPPPIDVAHTPALTGVFAPTQEELDGVPLELIAGEVPRDLDGAYIRNGPNARFPPIGSYTYPLDGDGMLHAVYLHDGRATYRNRYVRTPSMRAEEQAGHALWAGVMTLNIREDVGPEMNGRYKDLPDINIVRFARQYLALAEGSRQFAVTHALETIGPETFGGALPDGFCAHPKLDPRTGELVVFRYLFEPPFLTWAQLGPDGRLRGGGEHAVQLDGPAMIHDFAITEHHIVIFVTPLRFTPQMQVAWREDLPTRIAVIDRATTAVHWFEIEPLFAWHYANAFEDEHHRVTVDFPHYSRISLGEARSQPPVRVGMVRCTLDLETGTSRLTTHDERLDEYPRIDDRFVGRRHRFVWAARKGDHDARNCFSSLVQYDLAREHTVERVATDWALGEPAFAPRTGAHGEGDGYVMTFAVHQGSGESQFWILHAEDITAEPAAILRTPHRVPIGLHGNWFPAPL